MLEPYASPSASDENLTADAAWILNCAPATARLEPLTTTGKVTVWPGAAVTVGMSHSTVPSAAVLLAETSSTSPILRLGCTVDTPPAALTDEANAPAMSVKLMATDVTAESSFFISAFPFRAICSI